MKKRARFNFLLLGLTFLLLISMVSAQGCAPSGWKGEGKIYENKTVTITCPTCNFINFTAVGNDGVFLDNVQMDKNGSTFSYTFLGTDLTKVETIIVDGYSNLDVPLGFCFGVTMTGNVPSIGTYIMLILVTIGLFLLLLWVNHSFNEERRNKLYKNIVQSYLKRGLYSSKGNLGNVILYTLGYGVLKNLFMFYYLIIMFFMFIITELVESFAISSLITLFTTLLNIFIWGFVLVFIYMTFSFYEIIRNLIVDIAHMDRGIWNER